MLCWNVISRVHGHHVQDVLGFSNELPPGLQVFMKFLQSVYKIVYANERMPNRVSELRNIQQLQQKQFVWKALPFVEVAWIPYVLRNLAW